MNKQISKFIFRLHALFLRLRFNLSISTIHLLKDQEFQNSLLLINNMPKPSRGFSNQIMIGYDDLDKPKTIYLPAYLSAKINNIQSFQVAQSIGTINLTLYMLIYFGDLKKQFADRCCEEIELGPSRDDQFKLKLSKNLKKQVKQLEQAEAALQSKQEEQDQEEEAVNIIEKNFDQVNRTKTFIIRKSFEASLIPYPYFTPFEIHDLTLYFQTRKITMSMRGNNSKDDRQKLQVKINFMSTDRFNPIKRFKCLNFAQTGSFGQYDLAEGFLMYQNPSGRPTKNLHQLFQYFPFSKTGKKQVFDKQKNSLSKMEPDEALKYIMTFLQNKNFQYASFHFPMYRKPLVSFITIFLPLWALSFITLSLYFSANNYAKRVIAIATLNLAFVPTVQLVRQNIPQTPSLTLVEAFIYIQIISTCLLLLESNKISGNTEFVFEPFSDGYFLGSLVLSAIVLILPIIFSIIFCVVQATKFNVQKNQSKEQEQKDIESNNKKNKAKKYTNHPSDKKKQAKKLKPQNQQTGFKFNVDDWNYNQAANHFFYEKKRIYSVCSDIEGKVSSLKEERKEQNSKLQEGGANSREDLKQPHLQEERLVQLNTMKKQKQEEKIKKFKPSYKYFTSESSSSFQYSILINAINNKVIIQEDQKSK